MAEALIASARPGVRETEVYADMLHANLRGGGEEDMIWMSSGGRATAARQAPASESSRPGGW